MINDKNAIELAVRQGGLIRHEQAVDCGLSPSSIGRRVRSGKWRRISRGVFQLVEMDQPLDRVRAAVCALPNAIVSHETAAELHRIPGIELGQAVVTVPSEATHVFLGVTVHRTQDVTEQHVSIICDLPVTTRARTLCDLASVLHPSHLSSIVDDQIAAKKIDFDDFAAVVDSIRRRGKPGAAALGDLILERTSSGAPSGTRLERLGLQVLVEAGLPQPKIEYPAPWDERRRLDAAYPSARVGIEWDSKRWHTQIEAFENDRRRDTMALLHGWRVFRFTWGDVNDRPDEVSHALRTALAEPQIGLVTNDS